MEFERRPVEFHPEARLNHFRDPLPNKGGFMPKAAKKTYAGIQAQIARLQKEAEAVRSAEISDVVARIKEAIAHYGLTAADLGLTPRRGRKPGTVAAAPAAVRGRRRGAAKKPRAAVKFRDAAGNTWSGRGKRPRWFVEALASGRTPEELLVKD